MRTSDYLDLPVLVQFFSSVIFLYLLINVFYYRQPNSHNSHVLMKTHWLNCATN